MFSQSTFNIRVSVVPDYDVKNSFPSENRFVFRYYITIFNDGSEPVQLLKRKWLIYDFSFGISSVEGDGVIGLTPEIKPGENFTYFSNVILRSGVGRMSGTYKMKGLDSEREFEINIPEFTMISDVLRN